MVIGPSFKDVNLLKNSESNKIKLYYNANMYEIMERCDIAVSACGSTLYELAACGVPTLGLVIADNQEGIDNKMHELGIIKNMGWYDKLSKDVVTETLVDLCNHYTVRNEMSSKAKKVVDGDGVKRIVKILMNSIEGVVV